MVQQDLYLRGDGRLFVNFRRSCFGVDQLLYVGFVIGIYCFEQFQFVIVLDEFINEFGVQLIEQISVKFVLRFVTHQ